ncbi:MAG TPA: hypothetical protein VF677_09155 [Flavobacterium sp.]
MPITLFTIGDSISQGFMSGAAARTDLSYSTILAKILKAEKYHYPEWEKDGMPLNLETAFRRLERRLETDISGIFEWVKAIIIINNYIDEVEDYYERGPGSLKNAVGTQPFHNVSVRGFNVSDSWQLHAATCERQIAKSEKNGDNFFGIVSDSFHRTGYKVLASGDPNPDKERTQMDWLSHHHRKEGVENVILWLGANNALGTVLDLKIKQTSPDGTAFINGPESVSYEERLKNNWNLWHPEDFRTEYKYMLDKVIAIMEDNPNDTDYKVFIGTIPLVTICPLIKAVEKFERTDKAVIEWPVDENNPAPMDIDELSAPTVKQVAYGKYYPYFLFEQNFDVKLNHLNQNEILHIDECIRKYNRIIQELVAEANKKVNAKRFYITDIATALSKMALKRNHYNPEYEFPDYFKYSFPKVDSRYYGVSRDRQIKAGGLFSLDGVHPSAIGQGLIAYEFLKVMEKAGVFKGDSQSAIDWKLIFESDSLYSKPIGLLSEIYDNLDLKKWLYTRISTMWEKKKF